MLLPESQSGCAKSMTNNHASSLGNAVKASTLCFVFLDSTNVMRYCIYYTEFRLCLQMILLTSRGGINPEWVNVFPVPLG